MPIYPAIWYALIAITAVTVGGTVYFLLRNRSREAVGTVRSNVASQAAPVTVAEEVRAIGEKIEHAMAEQRMQGETQRQLFAQKLDAVRHSVEGQRTQVDGLRSELRHEVQRRDAELAEIREQLGAIRHAAALPPAAAPALPPAPADYATPTFPEPTAQAAPPPADTPPFEETTFAMESPSEEVSGEALPEIPRFEASMFEDEGPALFAEPMLDNGPAFDADSFEESTFEESTFQDTGFEEVSFAAPAPEPAPIGDVPEAEPTVEEAAYEVPSVVEMPADEFSFEETTFEDSTFEETTFAEASFEDVSFDEPAVEPPHVGGDSVSASDPFASWTPEAPAAPVETPAPDPAPAAPEAAWIARDRDAGPAPMEPLHTEPAPADEPAACDSGDDAASFGLVDLDALLADQAPAPEPTAPPAPAAEPAPVAETPAVPEPSPVPEGAEDLTVISTIDADVQRRLYEQGVSTLEEIAQWSRTDARRIGTRVDVSEATIMNQWVFEAQAALFARYAQQAAS